MQKRHSDRQTYFNELAQTSRDFYISYLKRFVDIQKGTRVLEIGCGEGGNLLPFAEIGCEVTGIDRSSNRIAQARDFFALAGYGGNFTTIDFFEMQPSNGEDNYDIILIHDVIEHIDREKKPVFIQHVKDFVSQGGVIFWGFPAWQMPFGGHQQICHNKIGSLLPFIHLFPVPLYRFLLKLLGKSKPCIEELLDIKSCKMTIESFERLMSNHDYRIVNRFLWFINPHYKQKFNLKPRKLASSMASWKYIRNFFCTSCFYVTQ